MAIVVAVDLASTLRPHRPSRRWRPPVAATAWRTERGTTADKEELYRILTSEKMNPLGIDAERFSVVRSEAGEILAFGQVEVYTLPSYSEIRSLFVREASRDQGMGSSVLADLLRRPEVQWPVLLTTIAQSKSFFQKHGFEEVQPSFDLPLRMVVEWLLGNVVARFAVGQRCLLMKKDAAAEAL